MAQPKAQPTRVINQGGNFVQSWGARVTPPATFSTAAVLPATAAAVTIPIVVSAAGFLIITASASGVTSALSDVSMVVKIDGVAVLAGSISSLSIAATFQVAWGIAVREPITAGAHTITLEFGHEAPGGPTLTIDPVTRPLQDSASLVVQEVAA